MPPDQLSVVATDASRLYHEGASLLIHLRLSDAIDRLRDAVRLEPLFGLALAALVVALYGLGRSRDEWLPHITRAVSERRASRRERQHIAVIALALDGRLDRASALGREHLQEFPDDVLVLRVLADCGADVDDLLVEQLVE